MIDFCDLFWQNPHPSQNPPLTEGTVSFLSQTHKTLRGTSAVSSDQEECYVLFIAKLWERAHTSCI